MTPQVELVFNISTETFWGLKVLFGYTWFMALTLILLTNIFKRRDKS